MPSIHGPSALLPRALREISAQLFPRLKLIPELRCWLPSAPEIDDSLWRPLSPNTSQTSILWHTLVQGAPLIIVLDLLGSKTGGSSLVQKDNDINGQATSVVLISEFLRRVEMLEAQGHLSYGEIFKLNELLDGSCCGFMKVLRTVQRVINCLEATYPNLYELEISTRIPREDYFEQFNELEIEYLEDLRYMKECIEAVDAEELPVETSFVVECLAAQVDRIITYEEHIVAYLQRAGCRSTGSIAWDKLLALKEDMYILGIGAYQAYCSQLYVLYGSLDSLCRDNGVEETLQTNCSELLQHIALPVNHIISFSDTCSNSTQLKNTPWVIHKKAFEITHPVENRTAFNSLCSAHLVLTQLRDDLLEVMRGKRTLQAKRLFVWNTEQTSQTLDPLGDLLLDDCLHADIQNSGRCFSRGTMEASKESQHTVNLVLRPENDDRGPNVLAFLFEHILLIGRPLADDKHPISPHIYSRYPAELWDLGPALRAGGPLNVLCTIMLTEIIYVYRPDASLEIVVVWAACNADSSSSLRLSFSEKEQLEQWVRILSILAPGDNVAAYFKECGKFNECPREASNPNSWLDELDFSRQRINSRPKPWSLIARKERTPPSSLYQFGPNASSEPSLFSPLSSPISRKTRFEFGLTTSPRSFSSVRSRRSISTLPEPIGLSKAINAANTHLDRDPLDLTGQVIRIGSYPAAHGGFSDVWKCHWMTGPQCRKVAVKVLRGKLLDAEREDKMAKRLQHEIGIWQSLNNENIIPLYGTCSDFGRYLSLVCPWYDNGSLHQYVRKHESKLSLAERLKLLSEVAAGLAYLHSCSVIHGDLSSSNILINDNLQACLCDFGLSVVIEDFVDSSYPSSLLGGAIRWSAPELYHVPSYGGDQPEASKPSISMSSDIYSYGSITLEVLSGKVPYHYLRHDGQVLLELSKKVKPQRTPSPFLTNDLWEFIGDCWNDNPSARPSTMHVSSQICLLHQRTLARHSM